MNHFDVDAVFIPNAIELRVMNCPEYACEAVIQRLNGVIEAKLSPSAIREFQSLKQRKIVGSKERLLFYVAKSQF